MNNNSLADEKVFPQAIVAENAVKVTAQATSELAELAITPAVQNVPTKVIKMEEEPNGIILTLETSGRTDILTYTHETSMYYTKPADKTVDEVFLHINLWTDDIFRVVFSKDKYGNPYQLPEEKRGSWGTDVTADFSNPEACEWYKNRSSYGESTLS